MTLSLRLKKSIILLLATSVVGLLLLVGGSTIQNLRSIQSLWQLHSHEATLHLSEINQIRQYFGYGGFVHNFKNYILFRSDEYRRRSEESLAKLMQALSKAEKLHLSPLERLAIAEIRQTAEAYREKYLLARTLIDSGKLPDEVAPLVTVNDHGAIDAFRLLSQLAVQREKSAKEDAGRRINQAIKTTLWGILLFPMVILVAILLWRFLNKMVTANSALERVTRELNATLENAPDAMLTILEDGTIVRANDQAEKLFGYSVQQLTKMRIEALVPESRRQGHEKLREGFMYEGEGTHKVAPGRLLMALASDGREIPVEIGLSVLRQDDGMRAIATIRDVTERLRSQRQIEELNESLQMQNEELESFSYSVSHDLRTPLRSIEGFSQLVEKRYASQLDATGADYLQRIRKATIRMGHLIDDLLQLSGVSRAEIKPHYINLSTMVEDILKSFAESEPERSVSWEVQADIYGIADPGLLRVVLENLLGNAWKYSSTREQAQISFSTVPKGEGAVFRICDNGVGFDMQYAGKLFGAFQRLHGVDEFEGTGIGLSTVQRIVHRHGGQIWAEAEPDKGACFYFTLGKIDERVISA
jgi:PAS domain S-box-containing protein